MTTNVSNQTRNVQVISGNVSAQTFIEIVRVGEYYVTPTNRSRVVDKTYEKNADGTFDVQVWVNP